MSQPTLSFPSLLLWAVHFQAHTVVSPGPTMRLFTFCSVSQWACLYLLLPCPSGRGAVTEGLRTFSIHTCCVEVLSVLVALGSFMWLQSIISGISRSSRGTSPVWAAVCAVFSLVGEDPPHLSLFLCLLCLPLPFSSGLPPLDYPPSLNTTSSGLQLSSQQSLRCLPLWGAWGPLHTACPSMRVPFTLTMCNKQLLCGTPGLAVLPPRSKCQGLKLPSYICLYQPLAFCQSGLLSTEAGL